MVADILTSLARPLADGAAAAAHMARLLLTGGHSIAAAGAAGGAAALAGAEWAAALPAAAPALLVAVPSFVRFVQVGGCGGNARIILECGSGGPFFIAVA